MTLQGKGFFIWQIDQCEGGDVQKIAQLAAKANLTHVLIKVADGKYEYWKNKDKIAPLVTALRSQGISSWGWQYVYGYEPVLEARAAIQQVLRFNLDGFIVNAESQYKEPGKATAAETYMKLLRQALPGVPLGLSSYRLPSYHPQLPWREFLTYSDYNFPQVYWEGAHNPASQLQRSYREFQAMMPQRTYFPTGAAYTERSWQPTPADLEEFLLEAQKLKFPGVNFWEWSAARRLGLWDTIANFSWQALPPKPKDIAEKYIEALNTRNVDVIMELYQPQAVHVTAAQARRGTQEIRQWYQQLFQQILPNATFTLTGYSGVSSSRHLTWEARSGRGSVYNGNDTLGLVNGLITYHYSYFTLS